MIFRKIISSKQLIWMFQFKLSILRLTHHSYMQDVLMDGYVIGFDLLDEEYI